MRKLLYLFLLTISFHSFSQEIIFNCKIINVDSMNIKDGDFYINNLKTIPKQTKTNYIFQVNAGDTIIIRHFEYEQGVYCIPQRIEADSIFYTFILNFKHNELEEFVVSSTSSREKQKKIAGESNENILDYLINPIENSITILKSIQEKYYIGYKNDSTSGDFELRCIPTFLNLDCLGNTYIHSKDSVYQFHISKQINFQYITILSSSEYKVFIENLISKTTKNVYFARTSLDHQKFTVISQENNNYTEIIYAETNESTYTVSKNEFNEIVSLYYSITDDTENMILQGKWDGNYSTLCTNNELKKMINHYKLFFTESKSNCFGVGMMDHISIINFNNDQIIKIKYGSHHKKVIPIDTKHLKNKIILYDYFFDEIYILASDHRQLSLFKLNTKNGTKLMIGEFDGVVSPTKIKIYGDSYYYLKRNEAGFNKLYQVKCKII